MQASTPMASAQRLLTSSTARCRVKAPDTMMAHIAMQESKDGKFVEWMEHVSDADYGKPVGK